MNEWFTLAARLLLQNTNYFCNLLYFSELQISVYTSLWMAWRRNI